MSTSPVRGVAACLLILALRATLGGMTQRQSPGKRRSVTEAKAPASAPVAAAPVKSETERSEGALPAANVESTAEASAVSDGSARRVRSRRRVGLLDRMRPFLPKRVYNWALVRFDWRFGDDRVWQERDDEHNDAETPPADERLRWHGVWLVEAYLPSSTPALIEGLELFGWKKEGDETVADFIANCRLNLGSGGSRHLPMLRPPTEMGYFFPGSLKRDLPPGVKLVTGQIQILSYSLTLLILGFRFDESISDEVDATLRRRYKTFTRRSGRRRSVMMPTFQRRDAMHDLEAAKIGACREWIAARVPGYFAATETGPDMPATALLTTKLAPLFSDAEWLSPIGLYHGIAYEQWGTPIVGLRYVQRSRKGGAPVLFGRELDLLADARLTQNGQSWEWLLPYYVEMELTEVFGLVAIDAMLTNAAQRLARLRDSIVTKETSSDKQLESVKRQLRSVNSDIASLTSEITTWSDRVPWLLRDLPVMQVVETLSQRPAESKTFRTRSLEWMTRRAREVGDLEAATRSLLIAMSEITGALENIRLQRSMRRLMWLTLFVALVALGVGALGAAHDLGWIGNATSSPRP